MKKEKNLVGTESTLEVAVAKKQSHKYDVKEMVVTAWGNTFKYERWDTNPEEAREYCLKGFIDDLQDCTVSIKKKDYPQTEKGLADYQADCLVARRELEKHINAGTRPARVNAGVKSEDKIVAGKVKELMNSSVISLESLIVKKALYADKFTVEDQEKLNEFMKRVGKK